jgi:biopolymer transport protein ExbD
VANATLANRVGRFRKHELEPARGIDMTPMIDVVFQLILFFMLTSALVKPNQIELDLPESSSGVKAQNEQVLTVAYRMVEGRPELKLNEKVLGGLGELGQAMKSTVKPEDSPRVDIRIDKTVQYQDVVAVMDSVRDAGFPKFSLLTLAPGGPAK